MPPGSEMVIITGLRVNWRSVSSRRRHQTTACDFGTNLPIWVTRSMIQLALPRDALMFLHVALDQVGRLGSRPRAADALRSSRARRPKASMERAREGHRLADLEPVLAHDFEPWPAIQISAGIPEANPLRMLRRLVLRQDDVKGAAPDVRRRCPPAQVAACSADHGARKDADARRIDPAAAASAPASTVNSTINPIIHPDRQTRGLPRCDPSR